jgi:hypothetical protein
MSEYRTVWDASVWGWSLATLAVELGVLAALLWRLWGASRRTPWLIATLSLLALMVAGSMFAPRWYEVKGRDLIVHLMVGSKRFDLAQLKEARAATSAEVFSQGTIRTFASGGTFGYYGYFHNQAFGQFLAFVTNRGKLVVLIFPDECLVLSPEDRDGFIKEALAEQPKGS